MSEKDKEFAKVQEAKRKDVERAFVILKGRFKILQCRAMHHDLQHLILTFTTCIVLHNMILRDEQAHGRGDDEDIVSVAQPMYGPPKSYTLADS